MGLPHVCWCCWWRLVYFPRLLCCTAPAFAAAEHVFRQCLFCSSYLDSLRIEYRFRVSRVSVRESYILPIGALRPFVSYMPLFATCTDILSHPSGFMSQLFISLFALVKQYSWLTGFAHTASGPAGSTRSQFLGLLSHYHRCQGATISHVCSFMASPHHQCTRRLYSVLCSCLLDGLPRSRSRTTH